MLIWWIFHCWEENIHECNQIKYAWDVLIGCWWIFHCYESWYIKQILKSLIGRIFP
jgi:hypothetical protein